VCITSVSDRRGGGRHRSDVAHRNGSGKIVVACTVSIHRRKVSHKTVVSGVIITFSNHHRVVLLSRCCRRTPGERSRNQRLLRTGFTTKYHQGGDPPAAGRGPVLRLSAAFEKSRSSSCRMVVHDNSIVSSCAAALRAALSPRRHVRWGDFSQIRRRAPEWFWENRGGLHRFNPSSEGES
jgi:hypothetical protein